MLWTEKQVRVWLVSAWRAGVTEKTPEFAGVQSWPALYILDFPTRVSVHTWAYSEAAGTPISELLRERPSLGSRDTFDRRVARGIAIITEELNAQTR